MFCGKCGKEIKEGVAFCPQCGSKINGNIVTETDRLTPKVERTTNIATSNANKKSNNGIIIAICSVIVVIITIVSIVIISGLLKKNTNRSYNAESSNNSYADTTESVNIPASSDKYDEVLVSGDGYNIVRKHVESYDSSYDEYGIIKDSGEWVTEMSETNYIATAVESLMSDGYIQAYYTPEFHYLGESMFAASCACAILGETDIPSGYFGEYEMHGVCQVINAEKKISFGAGGYLISKYKNGYTFSKVGNAGNVIRYDKEGNEKMFVQATDNYYIGEASCGLIYIDKKFYDVETAEVKIDLSEYDLEMNGYETTTDGGKLSFDENGECYFEFYNPSKNLYGVTINTKGEFISEPKLVE